MADRGQLARRVRLISYGPPSLSARPFLVLVPRIYPFPRGRESSCEWPPCQGRAPKATVRRAALDAVAASGTIGAEGTAERYTELHSDKW